MRLIDADALKEEVNKKKVVGRFNTLLLIDSAPTVTDRTEEVLSLQNTIAKLVEGIAENTRPQGEYVDISKLRLMTVEECAGHTIDYAMGWKACVEWIKKGGAE